MKRLIKKSYESGQTLPIPILVKDIQDKIENNMDGITYDTELNKEFNFENLYDCPEWSLQQNGGKQ